MQSHKHLAASRWLLACLLIGCGSGDGHDGDSDASIDGNSMICSDGEQRCEGLALEVCTDGAFQVSETCEHTCHPAYGCVTCIPDSGGCDGDIATRCNSDGSGFVETICDPLQGLTCDLGACVGACSPEALGASYVGCDYYPTVVGNPVESLFDFAVAVANPGTGAATVTVEGGALGAPVTFTVAPDSVGVQVLPWHEGLKSIGNFQGILAVDGAYHLRSTLPVIVYQFNPLQYFISPGGFSYTSDASLLLPRNVWNLDYLVASYPAFQFDPVQPGLLAITAAEDDTAVTLTTTARTQGGNNAPVFVAGEPQTVTLNAGDVLELAAHGAVDLGDLTGSKVTSDKPVQVIGGHYCANVPSEVRYCDHLEESMFPVATLGAEYVVTAPSVPSIPNGKVEVVRIIATQPDTTLTYDPPQAGAATAIATAGGFVEIAGQAADYVVSANHPILVVQYMEGQDAGGNAGDPAMALAVPIAQYRTDYLFHAPTNYEVNYVNVTAPASAAVMLDGQPVEGFRPIGDSGFAVARVILPNGADGNHRISADEAFGITVYGYGQYTSYWYPGGLGAN
jgi:IgGFc binding protein